MPAPRRHDSDDVLREHVRRYMEANGVSLRQVARELKVSPTGLGKFLDGSVPRAGTRGKVKEWIARRAAETRQIPPDMGETLFELSTLAGLTEEHRREMLQMVVEGVAARHRKQKTEPPEWIRKHADPE